MRATDLPVPGLLWGTYPERREHQGHRAPLEWLRLLRRAAADRLPGHWSRVVVRVRAHERSLAYLGVADFELALCELRVSLRRDGFRTHHLARACAAMSAACARTLGTQAFETQLIAAQIVLDGRLAEMATGEGKTLARGHRCRRGSPGRRPGARHHRQ